MDTIFFLREQAKGKLKKKKTNEKYKKRQKPNKMKSFYFLRNK